jgi:hypothetical protein
MSNTAGDAKTLAEAYKVLAHSLSISIGAATKLLDRLLQNQDTRELGEMMLKIGNDPNHDINDVLLTRNIHPEVIPNLAEILKREDKLAANIINADSEDKSTKNAIIYFSCQKEQIDLALSEALARSGLIKEIDRDIANNYLGKLKDNPMFEMKNLTVEKYDMLLQDISKLDFPLNRITLFPKHYEHNGTKRVDVGFLSEIQEKAIKDVSGKIKTVGPYSIPNIVKGLLVKQQMLENVKGSQEYEVFMNEKNEYRDSIKDKYFHSDKMRGELKSLSNVYDRIKRLNIDDREKSKLLTMLKNSSISKTSRDNFFIGLDKLEIDQNVKDVIAKKVIDLNSINYLVPATISFEDNEPVYTLDKNYMTIGSSVASNIDGKSTLIELNKAEGEIDYFMKSNMNLDNRTMVVLNEKEFENYKNKKRLKKDEIYFTKNGEEKISQEYKTVKELEEPSNQVIKTFNENKVYFEISTEGMDIVDIEAERHSPEFVRDLLMDNKENLLGERVESDVIAAAFDDVELNYEMHELYDSMGVDRIIEEVEQEPIYEDRDHSIDIDRYHTPIEEDYYYDRDRNGEDDRDQFH